MIKKNILNISYAWQQHETPSKILIFVLITSELAKFLIWYGRKLRFLAHKNLKFFAPTTRQSKVIYLPK